MKQLAGQLRRTTRAAVGGRYALIVEVSGYRIERLSGGVSFEDSGAHGGGHDAGPATMHASAFGFGHCRPGSRRGLLRSTS
jgi:hypothetical protein